MKTTRRDFLRHSAAGSAALGLTSASGALAGAGRVAAAAQSLHSQEAKTMSNHESKKLDLLILGGTGFLGPHIVDAAIERGHTMTLFNRGRTNPHFFPDLEKLEGNRDPKIDTGLTALGGRQWDAVIDTSGYVPRIARASADLLANAVKQYVFISTISVYPNDAFRVAGVDENTPVATVDDVSTERVTNETYGALKALCEGAVETAVPGRATIIRPGLIVGPLDPTDRFTYWPVRIDRGGRVLAPEPKDLPVQFIDGRDLARFTIHLIEQNTTGVFNATGPRGPLSMAELLYGCKAATTSPVEFVWIDDEFLLESGAQPFMELPFWIPGPEMRGFGQVSVKRALEAGLDFRPLADTARDTIAWSNQEQGLDHTFGARPGGAGMKPDKERRLIEAWEKREQVKREEVSDS